MKPLLTYYFLLVLFLSSCTGHKDNTNKKENTPPLITEKGSKITFFDNENMAFFTTETIENTLLNANITAPAKVSAMVIKSEEGASQNIILFENPDLASNYTLLIQHLININQIQNVGIKQKKIEFERAKDLQLHGAATGKELLETQTALYMEEANLANERAAIIEHETKLKAGGFQPELLRKAKVGTAYIICDVPENQISKIQEGSSCYLQFTAFPNEKFVGKIDDVADMIDQYTRMVKLRVSINNTNGKFKAGMFATVSFGISQGNNLSISKNSLVTVQGQNYVFAKTSPMVFQRKTVTIGNEIGDRIIIYSGLTKGDEIVTKGVMQLKGLSFGY